MMPRPDQGRGGDLSSAALIALSSAALARRVAEGLPGVAASYVEGLRTEASRFYQTDAAAARRIGRRAVELGDLLDDPLARGWGHRTMAEAYLFSGRMREAESSYSRAAAAWKRGGASALLGQLLVGRIHVLSLLGRHGKAAACARIARELLEAAGDRAYLAKLAMNRGNTSFQRDEYEPALAEYERAIELFRMLELRDESVIALEMNRAVVLTQLDRHQEALTLFAQLEEECEAAGLDVLKAQIVMNAAYVHLLRADFDQALRALARATSYFRETDHPAFLASCELNRAEIYHQLNLHQDALNLTDLAAPRFREEGLRYDEALTTAQGALSALALDDLPGAVRRLRRGRALFAREKNRSRAAVLQLLSAEALLREGRAADALRHARAAMLAFRRFALLRWEANATVLVNRLEAKRRAPARRIARLQDLLKRMPPRLYPVPEYRVLEALGQAQEEAGQAKEADQSYRAALLRLEDLRARIPTEDSKIRFLGDKTHLYDRLLGLELRRDRPSVERLFEWMERSRAQSLWDRLRDPSAYLDRDVEGDERRSELRRNLSWLHSRLSRLELGSSEERAQAGQLRKRLLEAEAEWSRLLRERSEAGPALLKNRTTADAARPNVPFRNGGTPPSIREVMSALPERWGFLSYHIGEGFALAVAITRAGARWRTLAPDLGARLASLADRLDFQWNAAALTSVRAAGTMAEAPPQQATQAALAAPKQGALRMLQVSTDAILGEMHSLLWAPLVELDLEPGLSWIVSPHGPIHRIPMHALRGPSGYLIESRDVMVAPSARIWLALPSSSKETRTAYVAGVPSPQLPAVEPEVACVADHLDGWMITRDLSPTREALRREGATASLVHLAAHGSLRTDNPAYSFVELSDGPLFVHDLSSFRLPASTVVLTACSSGRGAAPAGDEWIGLARGFLQAGASTVVASLWPIQDTPTLELMDEFYSTYEAAADAPTALGTAMRRVLKRRPHPWHWASFACLGGVAPDRRDAC